MNYEKTARAAGASLEIIIWASIADSLFALSNEARTKILQDREDAAQAADAVIKAANASVPADAPALKSQPKRKGA